MYSFAFLMNSNFLNMWHGFYFVLMNSP